MLALTRSGSSVVLREVPDPVPLSHEAIVRVNTFAVTHRDLLDLAGAWPTAGFRNENVPEAAVPGRDFAGTLVQYPAAIHPTATLGAVLGARVAGTVPRGAWAELVAVPYTRLAGLPDNVGDVFGATLPTPGLTALHALELGGFLVGKDVLVTGARGAVGRLACQLANLAGAHVRAFVRPGERKRHPLAPVPGAEIVSDSLGSRPNLIIDTVGGAVLGEAIESLEPQGLLVTVATPVRDQPISFRTWRRDRSAGGRIVFLDDLDEVTAHDTLHADLVRLVRLVAETKLDLGVEVERPWQEAAEVIDAVRERRIKGRAVLRVRKYAP
ncbi:zinc-binding dehydrogenase [Kribbella sp. GL6]|uniref:zinc-binding dehydrogenase n=1 Tax=Kribbella sp. GL6 TaxID=3419765 RepID=UPI003D002096